MVTQVEEVEVILYTDFCFKVLPALRLKSLLVDTPTERAKLDRNLLDIGALALV